jgi:hypothetical protein
MNSHKEQMCEANAPKINDLLSSLSSLLTSIPNDVDPTDPVKGNINMQQLLASMLTSMNGINKEGNNSQEQESGNQEQESSNQEQESGNQEQESSNQEQESGNQEQGNINMQQILASMITSMNSINQGQEQEIGNPGQEGCNINDLFSKLLGNMKDTEETLDDDYILSGDGGGDCDCGDSDCCGGLEGPEGCDEGDCCGGLEGPEGCDEEDVLSEEDFKEMITSFNDVNMMNNLKVMFEMLSKKIPHPPTNASAITNMEDVD